MSQDGEANKLIGFVSAANGGTNEYPPGARKPLFLKFVILPYFRSGIRNPGSQADFGNWIPPRFPRGDDRLLPLCVFFALRLGQRKAFQHRFGISYRACIDGFISAKSLPRTGELRKRQF
jgi:hypothetical protein